MTALAADLLDLPFDQYGRHRLVQQAAAIVRRGQGKTSLAVLDVGGFPCLTPMFLPEDRVIVVDPTRPNAAWPQASRSTNPLLALGFSGAPAAGCGPTANPQPLTPNPQPPTYVCADGCALPFAPGSFDLVVSLDSLEHVEQRRREAYVSELIAASRAYVLLVAPFTSPETVMAEQLLAEFIRVVNQEEQPQLREHREYGLPELGMWEAFLRAHDLPFVSFSSGYVHNWLPMMLVKHYLLSIAGSDVLHRALDRFYNETLRASDARAPGYRHGLLISKLGPTPELEEFQRDLAPSKEPDRLELIERLEQIGLLLKLADLHVSSRRDDRLREQILAKDQHILNIENALRDTDRAREAAEMRANALQAQLDGVRSVVDALRRGRVRTAARAFADLRRGGAGSEGKKPS